MTKQIVIIIAGRTYPLKINAVDEPVIRKIVKELNEQINQFQINHTNKDKQDCLALTSLANAIEMHKLRQSFDSTHDPNLSDKLAELNTLLDQLLQ